jgi:hypothetical protein
MCPQHPQSDPALDPVRLHVSVGERIDPAAADALWRIVLGGVGADPGGGPSAEGAGTRRTDRHPADAGGVAEAGQDGRT